MYLCYVDESGTSHLSDNSSHFVLLGIALPIWFWREADQHINQISRRYDLEGIEIHTAWMLRPYREQSHIPGFEGMSYPDRRSAVRRARAAELHKLRKGKKLSAFKQTKKNYRKTDEYIHLTYEQRVDFITDIALAIGKWDQAAIFAECIDKFHFDEGRTGRSIDEQAFEQVVSRFEQYLRRAGDDKVKGIVVHDNNEFVAKKHTAMMRTFHSNGTLWTRIERIIETPMFVDSRLTGMVQMADLCSFALRRYVESNDKSLFDLIYGRADRINQRVVGLRHYTKYGCRCQICADHR